MTPAKRWLERYRTSLTSKQGTAIDVILENLNTPTCATGTPRGLVMVPRAASDTDDVASQDCESTLVDPTEDVEAFNNGFVTSTKLPVPTT